MRRRAMLALGVVGLLLPPAACGGGGDADDIASSSASEERAPGALDADEVQAEITDLLAEYDQVVNQILADPQVTLEDDHPLVDEYLNLFEPDSDFAGEALETWSANAADGISIEPYDDAHPSNVTRLDGDIEIVSDDEVRFPTCSEFRQRVYEGDRVVEGLPFMEQAGESVAVRNDDSWVFRRRDVFADAPTCQTEGT